MVGPSCLLLLFSVHVYPCTGTLFNVMMYGHSWHACTQCSVAGGNVVMVEPSEASNKQGNFFSAPCTSPAILICNKRGHYLLTMDKLKLQIIAEPKCPLFKINA